MVDTRALPKAELHCHLDGILNPMMARDISRTDPAFPIDPKQLERAYPITDVASFLRWWSFIDQIESNLEYFCPILERHIEHLKAQRVLYSELMIAAGQLPRDEIEALEKLGALRSWIDQKEAGDIQVEFLIAIGRNKSPEEMEKLAGLILTLYNSGLICGVALAGPEQENSVRTFHKTFARIHEAGLGIEIHAGEWCGKESIWDALEYGYPNRIGHGVSLFQDPGLISVFQERQIHLELCVTSNLKTGSISDIKKHPISRAKELDLNFSINTDDPGPFECSMESEYALIAEVFGFGEEDFQRVYRNSLVSRFHPHLRISSTSWV